MSDKSTADGRKSGQAISLAEVLMIYEQIAKEDSLYAE